MDLYEIPAWRIAQGVISGDLRAVDVLESCLERLDSLEGYIRACLDVYVDEALEEAERVDRLSQEGHHPGPLAGVPVLLKDNICVKGRRTTCGSRMLEGWISPYDATVVNLLRQAGAVVVGKTNMDEFAMGSSTENSAFFPTSNPHDLARVPGGSSGGSAAAVAAGYVPLALGSDTGGSIRQPAAFCGIHGLKPTYGMVSRYGLVAFASSLDQIGPMARDMGDLALCMDVIGQRDPMDATSRSFEGPRFIDVIRNDSLKGLRVGILRGFDEGRVDQELTMVSLMASRFCLDAGAAVSDVKLPVSMGAGLASYYIIAPAEASSNLARFDGVRFGPSVTGDTLGETYQMVRSQGFGPEVKRRIMMGTYALSSGYYDEYYGRAQRVREAIREEFRQVFRSVDLLICPPSPCLPFLKGEMAEDPVRMYLTDAFTLPANLAGVPALTVYAGRSRTGLPLAVQLMAPWGEDRRLVMAGAVLERAFGAPSVVG
ncbi:glutamyl-tRNA(Gln) amidotransferase, A subunit [Thermanaerovibrio acidaminovorans DSM 6589]|uniref:Glutamyl-tRNA(Gln) amidotransferase subunit A n=1 Tax=Thermanaerovibrio acidaminovorans (strain ATCC 49978 / DSM 6589 / Su883) TaxID=525903 RepID=D1B5Q6_THEAS|nr:Asp-tRNA(Asn)/Glu-tRNA(Gln) amidotransferase subunit GatA [Thermanaerovibrio acidaminovorans]ACZ19347.1 glutamyl-tRNA(Gln) amidotransferase, A subunit [Thermanaerovibrio acidaminovorans DSM 6589]